MSGETNVIPGKRFDESSGENADLAKLNLLGKPSVRVNEQSIGTRELLDGSVTSDKLSSNVVAEINAEAIIGDSSITAAKIQTGAVTFSKLNQDVLDQVVRRDTVVTTVGSYPRYVNTSGVTEQIATVVQTVQTIMFNGNSTATTFIVTFNKVTAQTWQELQLYATELIESNGSFRIDSVVIDGAGGASKINYVTGVTYANQNNDDHQTHNVICTIIPTNTSQNSVIVTINITTVNPQSSNDFCYGVGRVFKS